MWTPFKPLAGWRNVHFGANANPASDGIASLVKHALGLDPAASAVAGLPTVTRPDSRLQMALARNTGATDVTLPVLGSDDPEGES